MSWERPGFPPSPTHPIPAPASADVCALRSALHWRNILSRLLMHLDQGCDFFSPTVKDISDAESEC